MSGVAPIGDLPVNPISVRRARRPIWDANRVTYLWECRICGRRPYHRSDRMSDRYRAAIGRPLDVPARERAIQGGLRHLHRKHTPCTCCESGHDPFTNADADSRFTNDEANS